jgi:hypothetical protein
MRAQYLGPGWDLAYVRGTPYNTGECLEMAIRDVSAKQAGQWSGCHSVAWDANAPANTGDREISNEFTKSGYPLGITINNLGVSSHFLRFLLSSSYQLPICLDMTRMTPQEAFELNSQYPLLFCFNHIQIWMVLADLTSRSASLTRAVTSATTPTPNLDVLF